MSAQSGEPRKTGKCWCGCNDPTNGYFVAGHDTHAQKALFQIVYGTGKTVGVLAMLDYSPSNSVLEARDRLLNEGESL